MISSFGDPKTVEYKNREFGLAYEQSYGFFDDIPNYKWKLQQEIAWREPFVAPRFNTDEPIDLKNWDNNMGLWYLFNYSPNFSCQFEQRVGPTEEGRKWICDPHRLKRISEERKNKGKRGCLVYSVGSAGNFYFEESLQELLGPETCEIHVFDFGDFESKMPKNKNIYYHQWGLTNNDAIFTNHQDKEMKTYDETRKILGHENDILDILKIDCEGCEWSQYESWIASNVRQVLVEVHMVPEDAHKFFQAHQKAGYVIFHKEPNTISPGSCCEEFSFIKLHPDFMNAQYIS